jgi:hypothetical protein
MAYCAGCGKDLGAGGAFCPACGAPQGAQVPAPAPAFSGPPGEAELRAFVGDKAKYYLPRFARFSIGGVDSFSLGWHWPAFLCGFWWMLYRKMYLWALALFVSACIPYVGVLAWFGWPMVANWIYYKEAKKRIAEVRAANPGGDITAALSAVGGVNRWVWPVAVILSVIGLLILISVGVVAFLALLKSGQCGFGGFGNG